MAANWSSLTIDPRYLERNQMVTPAFDQSESFQTNQSEYPNTPHSSFSSWPNAADVQASRMPSAPAGPNMDLGPSAIDMSLDPIECEFNDVMGAQIDTHREWSGQAGYEETIHFQQQNAGHSFQYPLPSFVFPSYEHDPNQGPQESNLDSQGLIISQPPAKSPPRHQMGYSVPPPAGPGREQQHATSSTGISVRFSEKRLSRTTINRKLKSRRRPMAQKRVSPAHATAQGKHTKSDGASSQSTTSSSEFSTNVDGLKAHTPKFQEAIAIVQESIKPFSPPFRRKAAALIDQVAELVKQLNQVAIDEELYGNASSDVEVDTQPSIASSSDYYISNPELKDSESNTDNTSVSSTPRQLVVENETPAFAENDQQGPIHPPCAQCGVKTLYFCTLQDKKTKKPCRYAHHLLAEWKRHMKTQKHSQCERFMCPECPNSPPAIDINGHSVCQFCEEPFPALGANLRAHYTQCQSAQRANKSYGRQDKLIDHLRSHPGVINLSLTAAAGRYTVNSEWPDECGFCGKTFSSFDEMLDDIAKHFQAGMNMSSWKLPFRPSKDFHPRFQPHLKGDDSDSDDDMDDNDSYPSHQRSGNQTKEASSFSSSGQSKRSNGNQKSGSSYQGGRRRCYLVPQATLDNSAKPIGSHASGHATTSVALERYLNDEEEPIELRLSQISSDISNSSPMFSAVATEDDLVSNVPDPEYVMHSLTLQDRGCFKETIPSTGRLQVASIGFSGFGFGIGDFFALGQLALEVYKYCKTASEDLKNLSSEILSLLEILQALRALQSDHSLPEWNQGTLTNHLSTCRDVLQEVQAQVEKRKSFKSDRKRMLLFDRLKWGKYDIDVLTTRLTRNRTMFEIFLAAASPSGGLQSALTLARLRQTICQGACMSKDGTGEYGVTNHIGEVFTGNGNETLPGLIVTDGAVIPTALGVNLFATITVLAERSVKYTAKCRIFQNINMESNDVLDLFGSPHQVNSDKQILHRRDTYPISEAKDLIRTTRAAKSNGFSFSEVMSGYIHVSSCLEGDKIEDYQTAAKTARGLCEKARFFLTVKAYTLQVDKDFSPSSKDLNRERGALNDEVISQGVPLQPTHILKMDPKDQWLASRISHQQAIKYKNLLDIRVKHSEALHWGSLDLLQGKGTGFFILLHCVPGIGTTAEAIAQANGKPLFKTTTGDFGMIPERLEIRLREKFHLASIWNYILLLDEADTVFAQWSQADMATNKNPLVSVFLRAHDYYNSILFLTTKRASVLDEAIKSRIHFKIYYPDLTLEQTLDIWKLNMNRVRRIEEQSESCSARSATAANIQRRESAAQGLLVIRTFSCIFENRKEPRVFKRKADWVRHENERHRQSEWWTCQFDHCKQSRYRDDNLLQHLVRRHKITGEKNTAKDTRFDMKSSGAVTLRYKQHLPSEAKCNIDTGNQQGNFRSLAWIMSLLQSHTSNFKDLMDTETRVGFKNTGHTPVAEGTISLPWYHRMSPQVFHNTRFLVSPSKPCDVIIGAHFINDFVPMRESVLSRNRSQDHSPTNFRQKIAEHEQPDSDKLSPLVDLFVHGLIGGCRKTWSKTTSQANLWTPEWPTEDPGFKHSRFHTFGYNSEFAVGKGSTLNIQELAKSLLGEINTPLHLAQADTPLILIGHSLGGLIVTNTYVREMKILMNETPLRLSMGVWTGLLEPGIDYRNRYWCCTLCLVHNSVEDVGWKCASCNKLYNHELVKTWRESLTPSGGAQTIESSPQDSGAENKSIAGRKELIGQQATGNGPTTEGFQEKPRKTNSNSSVSPKPIPSHIKTEALKRSAEISRWISAFCRIHESKSPSLRSAAALLQVNAQVLQLMIHAQSRTKYSTCSTSTAPVSHAKEPVYDQRLDKFGRAIESHRQTQRPISTNVVIVGAGVIGLKTALKLSREQGQSFYESETKRKPAYVNDIDEGKRERISIISTTGPKENTQETISKLRKVGQNVVRMNFCHPRNEPHKSLIDSVLENGRSKDCRRVPSPGASVPQQTSSFTCRRPAAIDLPPFQLPPPDHCRSHIRDTGKEDLGLPTSCKGKEKEPKYGAYYNAGAHLRRAHFKPMSKMAGTKNNRKADGRSDWSQETEMEYYCMGNNQGQVSSNTVTKEQDESIENSATSRDSRYGTPRAPIPRSLDRTNGEAFLDNRYKVRNDDYKKCFKLGQVFSTLWDAQSLDHAFVVQSGQKAYCEIRRFVVVRSGDLFATCLPVTTYGGSGVTKRGVKVSDHSVIYSCDRRAHDLSGVSLQQSRSTPSNRPSRKLETPKYIQGREEEHDGPSKFMKARTRILENQGWLVPFIDYLPVHLPPRYILHIPEARPKHGLILSSIQDTGKQHIGLDDQELTNSNNPGDQNEPHEYHEFPCIGSLDDISRACFDCPLEFVSFPGTFSEYLQPLLSHH